MHPPTSASDDFYHGNNVFGNSLALLRRHRVTTFEPKIHLDIGCGYGLMAESLSAEFSLTYIGVSDDAGGLASLLSRGFEVHSISLSEVETIYDALLHVVGSRRIHSITLLDTLGHLRNGDALLRAISNLAAEHSAFVVVSVPNVAHLDIGLKAAFGRWDYSETGLLDHTHVRLFGADGFGRILRRAGLYAIDTNDVHITESNQHFPRSHPALARCTLLHAYLAGLRRNVDRTGSVYQFVRICVAAEPTFEDPYPSVFDDRLRPFLSIIIRTQGKRPHTLTEALTALCAQTNTDFEIVIVGHQLSPQRHKDVKRIVEDSPEWLRGKCRLLQTDGGNRTRPLNLGFAAAEGRYIAILDDDDLPFGHWVESFHRLAEEMPERLLRSVAVRQVITDATIGQTLGVRSIGRLENIYPLTFDFLEHLRVNHSPPVSVAFPRGVFHDLGLRFDEKLTTTEDWDYIMRVAAVAGTVCGTDITAIYHWWYQKESSQTVHSQDEWRRNHAHIFHKMDNDAMLFPAGTTARIRFLQDHYDSSADAPSGVVETERVARLREVTSILNSTSWRITAPLRTLSWLRGRQIADYSGIWNCQIGQLIQMALALRQSTSWRITAPLRRLRRR